ACVPVVNMESAREHPCQGLADLLTLRENFGDLHGLPITLSWAPHVKPLPRAVPNSFLLTAVALGCEVRVAHPPGFDLHEGVLAEARELANSSGGRFSVTHDQYAALDGAAAVYVKSWGPMGVADVAGFPIWKITREHLRAADAGAFLMHCLPVRRNLVVADEVLDREPRKFLDQAENRMHVQAAVLDWLWNG
ncbi:MAG: N-acetylornithine carbamoyltransferase, partial [Gammaproteobacteria bacterium]